MKQLTMINLLLILFFTFSCETGMEVDVKNESFPSQILERNPKVDDRQDYWDLFQVILPCEAGGLTYFIDEDMSDEYVPVIESAIGEYNNLPSSIHFTLAESEDEADIIFTGYFGFACGEGFSSIPFPNGQNNNVQTNFPSGGSIGKIIYLADTWFSCPCNDDTGPNCTYDPFEMNCVLKRTVMNNIGHALGIANNGTMGLTNIPGTPNTSNDPGSIFNPGMVLWENCDWCDSPCEFNENDITAIQFLYPSTTVNFDITYNAPICMGDVVTFNILPLNSTSGWNQNLSVINWSTTGGLNLLSNSYDFAIVEALSPGSAQICATVLDASNDCGNNEHTYCINVNVNNDANCTGDGEIPNPK